MTPTIFPIIKKEHLLTVLDSTPDRGSGSGSALNPAILITAGISALVATVLATFSIWLQLKNYRRPILQRYVFLVHIPRDLPAVVVVAAVVGERDMACSRMGHTVC